MKETEIGQQVVSYVGEFILGAIALLAIGIAYWAIRELKKAHIEHVKDLKLATKEHVQNQKDSRESNAAVIYAIEKLTLTVNSQTTALRDNTRASGEVKGAIDGLKSVVDSVIRDAVRGHARHIPLADPPSQPG